MNRITGITAAGIFLIAVFIIAFEANAQEKRISKKDVPQAVISAFEKSYPNAKVKAYSTEKENGKTYYEVESMQGKSTLDVSYLSDGTAAEIEEGVKEKDLPTPVVETVNAKYPKDKIVKAEKRTVGTSVTYEVRVKIGKAYESIVVDPTGNIITEQDGEED